MMKTRDCVEKYVKDMLEYGIVSRGVKANSCYGIYRFFVSYDTPICEFIGGKFHLVSKKYSVTTSRQQNYLRHFIPSDMLVEVCEIKNERFPHSK